MIRLQGYFFAALFVFTGSVVSLLLRQSHRQEIAAAKLEASIHALEITVTTGDLARAERHRETRQARPAASEDQPDPLHTRLAKGLAPIENAHDQGLASPQAAVETSLWAIHEASVERLVQALEVTPSGAAEAQALFDGLPPAAQAEYRSPTYLLGTLIVYGYPVAGYRTGEAAPHPGDPYQWSIQASVQLEDGRSVQPTVQLHETNGAWRIEADQQLVQQFASFLKSAAQ